MIKKVFAVFYLYEAVCGLSSKGFEYDNETFVISRAYQGVFDTEIECEKHIMKTMEDYEKRNVSDKTRFIILPVFCMEGDVIFNKK